MAKYIADEAYFKEVLALVPKVKESGPQLLRRL